ncbi:MAG: hypothetical protein ACYCVH_15540 [Ignavibacteriaceae bacterium]
MKKFFKTGLFFYLISVTIFTFSIGATIFKGSKVRIGLSDPHFHYISSNWIPQYNKIDMHDIWLNAGINREGFSYYFLPKAKAPDTCSERFNPDSKYFQAWFGIYTVSDNSKGVYAIKNNKLNAMDIIKLGIADQKVWLNNFARLDTPKVYLDTSYNIKVKNVIIDQVNGWEISARIISNTDVGVNNIQNLQGIYKVDKSVWKDVINSYQMVGLDAYLYVWYSPENKKLNVAYFNGAEFIDKNSIRHNTIDSIKTELKKMVDNITVYK